MITSISDFILYTHGKHQLLSHKVGLSGTNLPIDVAIVSKLLSYYYRKHTYPNPLDCSVLNGLPRDGVLDDIKKTNLVKAIEQFQRDIVKLKNPDKMISPQGKTIAKLIQVTKSGPDAQTPQRFLECMVLGRTDPDYTFFDREQVCPDRLKNIVGPYWYPHNRTYLANFEQLVQKLLKDPAITNIHHLAYMLATVKVETNHTFDSIGELGQGKSRSYGKTKTVTMDDNSKKKVSYYGRGYVQLTLEGNYKRLGTYIKNSYPIYNELDLVRFPEQASEPQLAYLIMVDGITKGLFSGAKLKDYDTTLQGFNYKNARNIINGEDRADIVAKIAETFELALRLSQIVITLR